MTKRLSCKLLCCVTSWLPSAWTAQDPNGTRGRKDRRPAIRGPAQPCAAATGAERPLPGSTPGRRRQRWRARRRPEATEATASHGVGSRRPPCPLASPLPRRLAHPRLQGARGQLHGHREPTSSSPWHVGLTKRETVSCLGLQIATCHRGLPMRSLAYYFQNTENKRF